MHDDLNFKSSSSCCLDWAGIGMGWDIFVVLLLCARKSVKKSTQLKFKQQCAVSCAVREDEEEEVLIE